MTQPPPRRWPNEPDREDVDPEAAEILHEEAFQSVDGAAGDEDADPAFQAVIEAGGGVSEGFEQAEAMLVDNATDEDSDDWSAIERHVGAEERNPDREISGDADHEHVSEGGDPDR